MTDPIDAFLSRIAALPAPAGMGGVEDAVLARLSAEPGRTGGRIAGLIGVGAALAIGTSTAAGEAIAIGRDSLRRTFDAVDGLRMALREPLLRCAVEELSQSEAAQALGIGVKTVETRLRRARAALRQDRLIDRPW